MLWAATPACVDEHQARRKARPIEASGVSITQVVTSPMLSVQDVAVIDIHGDLMDTWTWWGDCCTYGSITDRLYMAAASNPIAIVLWIKSRGGMFAGCIETHKAIIAFREAHPDLPVVSHIDVVGCSGGYEIACAAQYVTASETAQVGSIGVVQERYDYSGANAQQGVAVHTITSGEAKADGNGNTPMTPAEMARTQGMVQLASQMFFETVEAARPQLAGKVAGLEARVYFAAEAAEIGLIDEVSTLDAVIAALINARSEG